MDLLQSSSALSAEEINTNLNQIILPIEDLHEGLRPIFERYIITAKRYKEEINKLIEIEKELDQISLHHFSSQRKRRKAIEHLYQNIALITDIENRDNEFLQTVMNGRFSNIKIKLREKIKALQSQTIIQPKSSQKKIKIKPFKIFFRIYITHFLSRSEKSRQVAS